VRDRVQDLIKKGSTLDQVKAAKPSRDYDPEYIRSGGPSADAFVESVYRSLTRR
jgi:cyclase